ncbi:MAG: ketoacyl-ACP synthase III, partial [Candidatus Omnitrophica bacterium]|nr:ketoacyl-ACP synthase III [Candidatus Omnitrophota bacterium]
GIQERRIAQKGTGSSVFAYEASKIALKRAGVKPKDIQLIIVATITADMPFPSVASLLQNKLGAKYACAFDISAACAGFIYALTIASQFLATGFYKNALVVGSEVLSAFTDWKDRTTCVLFGDGSAAAVLVPSKKRSFLSSYLACDGLHADLLCIPAGGSKLPASQETVKSRLHYIKMQGNELFRLAVRAMVDAAKNAAKKANIDIANIDLFIPHQANLRIISAVAKRLNISFDKVYVNISKYGNTSAASIPIALTEAYEEGRIKKDNLIVLDAFGGGLVWASCVIKWV